MLPGFRSGKLTVVKESDKQWHGFKGYIYECICDCGRTVHVAGNRIRHPKWTLSCGCARPEAVKRHGLWGTPTYYSWAQMLSRCRNQEAPEWPNYGGRGIKVCERWEKFENFLSDMGIRPNGRSIDRINNNGNYEPGNCRWATRAEQNSNSRRNRLITHNGITKTMTQWSKDLSIPFGMIRGRLDRGWSGSDALTIPKRSQYG